MSYDGNRHMPLYADLSTHTRAFAGGFVTFMFLDWGECRMLRTQDPAVAHLSLTMK
ncbi:MAG: hypothetical protein R2838_09175 [Caldilineaceae bacterium]